MKTALQVLRCPGSCRHGVAALPGGIRPGRMEPVGEVMTGAATRGCSKGTAGESSI